MARTFRFYGKKRGDRRTGSSKLGSVGELLFYTCFLAVGCAALVMMFTFLVVPYWRVNNEFPEHTCIVLDKRIGETASEDSALYRPELLIEYRVDGQIYRTWTYDIHMTYSSDRRRAQEILSHFKTTADAETPINYPCWYDPLDPSRVVLVRQSHWWVWLIFIVPVSFILIGGGGLLYHALRWDKSTERRAAFAQRVPGRDLFEAVGGGNRRFPNIPLGNNITNSPGTRLRFRLPIATSAGWILFAMAVACILWNGIVSVFVAMAIGRFLHGNPDWFLTLFTLPFVAVGVALIIFFIRQLLVTTGIGPTLVEISAHPLLPGDSYKIFVSQTGRLQINQLTISLVCQERATYRQGTDTRTETREVLRQTVHRREGFEIHHGLPFEVECEFQTPPTAMHSFKSEHNEIQWNIEVWGNVHGWPDYRRSFPVVVHPQGSTRR